VGPSGSGKSSVVKAGLLPALRKGSLPGSEHWFITEMVPSAYPLEELELALLRIAIKQPPSLLEQLEKDERGLLRAARRVLPQDGELLLIVDQLEEVFTLIGDPRMSAFFLQSLYEAVIDPRSPVRVVVTLRADFYDRPLMHPDFSTLMKKRTEVVVPLTSEELERAIRAPAERAGVVFEKGLVASIIADVVDQPGTLPLLQYALTELFERREGRLLTQRAYHSIEGVLGALGRRAEEVYRGLNEDEKESARQLFLRLVTLGEGNEDTRRRALNSELESLFSDRQSKISNIINTFGQARLLTFDRDPVTRGATVEVAHEALLHKWRRLDEWLDQSRADLRMQRVLANATAEWLEAKQDSSFLLRGTRLAQFEAWIATTSLALTQAEEDYLDASLVERRAHLEAETQRRQRELEQISIGLAGQALNELHGTKPERAVLLALEALEDYPYTWQAHRALGEAVMNHRLEMVLSHEDVIYSIEMSKDGTRLLTASKDGTVRMWDAATGEELLVLSKGAPLIALWSPDECSILTIGSDWHSIQLWDISTSLNTSATASDLRFIQEVDSKINIKLFNWFPWSPKGDRFVTAHDDGARIWNAADGTVQFILSGHEDTVTNAAWSPTGDHIVTTSRDLSAILWEANTGRALSKFPFTGKGLNFGEWSPSGDCFILQVFDRASIYETVTGAEVLMLSLPGLMIRFARFSPDGNQLITTTIQDGNARLWDAETGQLLSVLTGLTQESGISWSPSGEYATVVGTDGSIRIWDTVTGLELQRFPFLGPDFGIALWSPSEDHIYAAGDSSNEVKVFKLSAALSSIPGLRGITYDASWSPDGREFSRSNPDGTVVIRDAETRAEVMTLESGTNYACTTRWSPSGDRFLTTNGDGTTRIWDASSGELLLEFIGHESYVFSGEWSPDGSRIVTTEPNKDTMILWDATTGEQIWKLNLPGVMKAVWSPDGTRLAVTSSSGHGSITDAASGEVLLSFFEDYPAWVEGPAWSSDGNKVVMFSGGNGWIFDTSTGEQLVELSSGFISSVWVVYWSPGDDLIFTLGGDGTYRVFEAATGVELLVYDLGGNWPSGALSPDGTRMLITTDDGKTSLYPTWLTIEQLITYAKEHCVFRQLTTAERQLFGLPDREEKDTPS
jgi:WD40 repeat protein